MMTNNNKQQQTRNRYLVSIYFISDIIPQCVSLDIVKSTIIDNLHVPINLQDLRTRNPL